MSRALVREHVTLTCDVCGARGAWPRAEVDLGPDAARWIQAVCVKCVHRIRRSPGGARVVSRTREGGV